MKGKTQAANVSYPLNEYYEPENPFAPSFSWP